MMKCRAQPASARPSWPPPPRITYRRTRVMAFPWGRFPNLPLGPTTGLESSPTSKKGPRSKDRGPKETVPQLIHLEVVRLRLALFEGDLLGIEIALGLMPGDDAEFDARGHALDLKVALVVGDRGVGMVLGPDHGGHPRMEAAGQVDRFAAGVLERDL